MTGEASTRQTLLVRELEPLDPVAGAAGRPTTTTPLDLGAPHNRTRWPSLFGTAETYTNLRTIRSGRVEGPKRIVICADGTWNSPSGVRPGEEAPSNVWLLYQLIRDFGPDGMPQLKYYHAGVGTGGTRARRILDGMTGRGLSRNMLDCYRFLVEHYVPGDHVYLFGFSRGAYTVRTLAGMIRNSGILRKAECAAEGKLDEWIRSAYALYRNRDDDTSPSASRAVDFRHDRSHPDFAISCIGVWDTVGSLGVPTNGPLGVYTRRRYGFHDVTLSAYVDRAFQALAVDERRGPFRPTLWAQHPHARLAGQVLEQVWFSGVHSDVGGGYRWEERGLANLTLRWMINRVSSHCRLCIDTAPLEALEAANEPRLALHDSMSFKYRLMNLLRLTTPFDRHIDRGLGSSGRRDTLQCGTETLHPSVARIEETFGERFPVVDLPYGPANVRSYRSRSTVTAPTSGEIERLRDVKVRRASDRLPPLVAEIVAEPGAEPDRSPTPLIEP